MCEYIYSIRVGLRFRNKYKKVTLIIALHVGEMSSQSEGEVSLWWRCPWTVGGLDKQCQLEQLTTVHTNRTNIIVSVNLSIVAATSATSTQSEPIHLIYQKMCINKLNTT